MNYAQSTDGSEDAVIYAIPISGPNAPDWVDVFDHFGYPQPSSRTADFIPEENLEEVFRYPKRNEGQEHQEWENALWDAFTKWLKEYNGGSYWPPW